jgi:hypothetical protein
MKLEVIGILRNVYANMSVLVPPNCNRQYLVFDL